MQPNLSLSSVEVLADVLLDLDEAHLALGVPATLVLLLPRGVATLELAPENGQIVVIISGMKVKESLWISSIFSEQLQGRAKLMELSLVTHVPSGPIGCAWAGHFVWQK